MTFAAARSLGHDLEMSLGHDLQVCWGLAAGSLDVSHMLVPSIAGHRHTLGTSECTVVNHNLSFVIYIVIYTRMCVPILTRYHIFLIFI